MKNEFVSKDIGLTYNKQYVMERLNVECNVWKQDDQQRLKSLHKTCDCQSIIHKKERVKTEVNTDEENDKMRASHFSRCTPECREGRNGHQLV